MKRTVVGNKFGCTPPVPLLRSLLQLLRRLFASNAERGRQTWVGDRTLHGENAHPLGQRHSKMWTPASCWSSNGERA